jgi:hemolysin type calcium-binding protein
MAVSVQLSRTFSGEFRANSVTTFSQLAPDALGLSNGGFVVAFNNGNIANGLIQLDFYDGQGLHVTAGTPFDSAATTDAVGEPSLTELANGNVLVVWDENNDTGSQAGIKGALFTQAGALIDANIDLDSGGLAAKDLDVTALSNGNFVVSFAFGSFEIAQVYTSAGVKVGGGNILNQVTAGTQKDCQIVALGGGGFAAMWTDVNTDQVKGRVFENDGTPRTDEFAVSGFNGKSQVALAATPDGGFAAVYRDTAWSEPGGDGAGITLQLFNATGGDLAFVQVTENTEKDESDPDVTVLANDFILVSWSVPAAGANIDIMGRLFDANGAAIDLEGDPGAFVLTNTATVDTLSTVSRRAAGEFVAAWQDSVGDGSGGQITARLNEITRRSIGDDARNLIVGDALRDVMQGGKGADTLDGGGADDVLSGGEGADSLLGGDGDDSLAGGDKNDTLRGGAGNDILDGTEPLNAPVEKRVAGGALAESNVVFGEAGDDRITGGEGRDVLDGDNDTLGAGGDDTIDGAGGDDVITGGGADDVIFGGAGDDQIHGGRRFTDTTGTGRNAIEGGEGDDSLTGEEAADTLLGGVGDDTLKGRGGGDVLNGGDDFDIANYVFGAPAGVIIDLLAGTSSGGHAQGDTLIGIEAVIGTSFADRLTGDAANNRLDGEDGSDTLLGGEGRDTIRGGSVFGESAAAADRITGGKDADILNGDAGGDLFVYLAVRDSGVDPSKRDLIADFSRAQGDRIDLSAIDARTGGADNAFVFSPGGVLTGQAGQLIAASIGDRRFLVQGDVDGDGVADFAIEVFTPVNISAMQAIDFVL